MTIKDIERIGDNIQGDIVYYLEELTPVGITLIYFRIFNSLLKYVKENYNDNLVRKDDASVSIVGVRLWRKD